MAHNMQQLEQHGQCDSYRNHSLMRFAARGILKTEIDEPENDIPTSRACCQEHLLCHLPCCLFLSPCYFHSYPLHWLGYTVRGHKCRSNACLQQLQQMHDAWSWTHCPIHGAHEDPKHNAQHHAHASRKDCADGAVVHGVLLYLLFLGWN